MSLEQAVSRALVSRGVVDERRFDELSRFAADSGMTLTEALVQQGGVEERRLLEAYGEILGVDFSGDLSKAVVPSEFVEKVPVGFARGHNCIAIGRQGSSYLVAACDPADIYALDNVAQAVGAPVLAVLAPRSEVAALIDRIYQEKRDIVEEAMDELGAEGLIDSAALAGRSEDVLDVAHKPPIIRLVNLILTRALRQRASDVHLQPYEDRLQVRYRIDGILYDRLVIPKSVQEAVISRVKVMGRMDIAEKRMPQDGRASIKVSDREVDLRISSVPTAFGERIVLRLLDKGGRLYELASLGLGRTDYDRFHKLIQFSHGIILVTGPTGSGKTTTLYSVLQKINRAEKNIITIEDPIEYHLRGISADSGRRQGADLRDGASPRRAPGPRRHHGRRDPRRRDRAHRHPGGAHRPPRLLARFTPTTPPAPSRGSSTSASSRTSPPARSSPSWPSASSAASAPIAARRTCLRPRRFARSG